MQLYRLRCPSRRDRRTVTSKRHSVRASLRLMVKRILRKYKYPPDRADEAVELVLQQAEAESPRISWRPIGLSQAATVVA
ncbi:MAG: type I restriction enzyme endonuclease domain-containing protein [Pseudomonadota bacterium]